MLLLLLLPEFIEFIQKKKRIYFYKWITIEALTIGCCGCSFMVWAVDDGICWIFACCCCWCGCCAVICVAATPIKFVWCWFVGVFWLALAWLGEGCGTAAGAGLDDACCWFFTELRGETTPPKFNAFRPRPLVCNESENCKEKMIKKNVEKW